MNRRIIGLAGVAAVAALTLSGCSTISTEPDQVALHYSGGSMSSKNFQDCVPAAKRETNGPGDGYFVYPDGGSQRDFTADSSKPDREADTIKVNSSDNQELAVPMTVTFYLNTDCTELKVGERTYAGGMLQLFHEQLAKKRSAYWNADAEGDARSDGAPQGWVNLLNFAVGVPLDRSADRLARSYTVNQLWQDPEKRVDFETKLNADLATLVDAQMGAPLVGGMQMHFFTNIKVSVGQPDPTNEQLKANVKKAQADVAAADSAEKKANADKAASVAKASAAVAEVAVANAEAAKLKAEHDVLGDDWAKKYAIDHNMNPYQQPIVVPGYNNGKTGGN